VVSRARSVLVDSAHYISRRLVEVAREYNAVSSIREPGETEGKQQRWKEAVVG